MDYVFDKDDWEMVFEALCFYDMHKEEDSFNDKQDLAWRTLYNECRYQLDGKPDNHTEYWNEKITISTRKHMITSTNPWE